MAIPSVVMSNGISYIIVDGLPLSETQTGEAVKYAVTMDILRGLGNRKQFSNIVQLWELVIPGLILSTHLFQGLNRNLYCDGVFEGDTDKFVFSRKPAYDFYWEGGREGKQIKKFASSGQVFVVVVSKNTKHQEKFPEICGWIEHWNWVDEDTELSEAPINWVDRYKQRIWSKN